MASVLKTEVSKGTGGSNPSPSVWSVCESNTDAPLWPYHLTVRIQDFQFCHTGSNPVRVIILLDWSNRSRVRATELFLVLFISGA